MESKSILFPGSGRIGNMYATRRYGKQYVSQLPMGNKSNTEKQQNRRMMLAAVSKFASLFTTYVRVGWKNAADGMSAYSAFSSHLFRDVVSGEAPNFVFDYERLLVSKGPLVQLANLSCSATTSGIRFTWSPDLTLGAAEDDVAMPLIYNVDKEEVVGEDNSATRVAGTYTYRVPQHWSGDEVYAYMGIRNADYSRMGNGRCLGRFTVA